MAMYCNAYVHAQCLYPALRCHVLLRSIQARLSAASFDLCRCVSCPLPSPAARPRLQPWPRSLRGRHSGARCQLMGGRLERGWPPSSTVRRRRSDGAPALRTASQSPSVSCLCTGQPIASSRALRLGPHKGHTVQPGLMDAARPRTHPQPLMVVKALPTSLSRGGLLLEQIAPSRTK